MKTLEFGTYAIGILTQLESTPWKNDPSKHNHHIVLSQPYQDKYGNQQTEVLRIEVFQDDFNAISSQMAQLTGKQVVVPARFQHKKFNNNSWLAVSMPSHSIIYPFESVIKTDSK